MFGVLIATIVCCCAAAAAVEPARTGSAKSRVAISIAPKKATVLVGQPFVVAVRLDGFESLPLRDLGDLAGGDSGLAVFIDSGTGFARHQESALMEHFVERQDVVLGGRPATVDLVLVHDSSKRNWVFPAPGRYRVMVEYKDASREAIRSNTATIQVRAPEGTEAEVFRRIQRLGWRFLAMSTPERVVTQLVPLVDEFSESVYLQRTRVNDLLSRVAKNPTQAELPALIELAQTLSEIDSPFAATALLTLAELQERAGDVLQARASLERLQRDFPDRAAADAARDELKQLDRRTVD